MRSSARLAGLARSVDSPAQGARRMLGRILPRIPGRAVTS